jgi:hypothetical protein
MQFLSGLTLLLLPYSVDTQFELVYTLEHVESGRKWEAKASDSFRSITQLLLLPISPFAMGGAMRTYKRLADHLYDQLAKEGAFDPVSWDHAPTRAPARSDATDGSRETRDTRPAVARLRLLGQLRKDGVITGEEYERRKREILKDL